MKKLADWMKTWTTPQVIGVSVGMVCTTAFAIAITVADDWGKLVRWLADPTSQGLLVSIGIFFATLYFRARGLPPPDALKNIEDSQRPSETRPTRTGGWVDPKLLVYLLGLGWIIVFVLACVHGCSPSALQINATLASGAADMTNAACPAVEHARDAEQHAALDANATREAASAAVDAVRSRWEPFVFACNIAADAQNAWADFLVSSLATGIFDLAAMIPIASRFVLAYEDLLQLHPPLPDGVTLPAIDPNLLALIAPPTGGAQ